MILAGVDGGGTKTHVLVLNEHGQVIGSSVGGRANYHRIGLDAVFGVLSDVCQQALKGQRADMISYCLADCDTEIDHARLSGGIAQFPFSARFACYNDAFAALRAGSSRPYGVGIICGTGFNACGIGPDGRQAKLHSLGALTGDWGGGYSLGEAIFAAVFRAEEGRGKPTLLTALLLNALGLKEVEPLAQLLIDSAISDARVAEIGPLVFEAAVQGDEVAQSIVARQADEISVASLALLRRLDMINIPVDVALGGGVMRERTSLLVPRVSAQILAENPFADVHRLVVPPVVGAALLAFDALGLPTPAVDSIAWAETGLIVEQPINSR